MSKKRWKNSANINAPLATATMEELVPNVPEPSTRHGEAGSPSDVRTTCPRTKSTTQKFGASSLPTENNKKMKEGIIRGTAGYSDVDGKEP